LAKGQAIADAAVTALSSAITPGLSAATSATSAALGGALGGAFNLVDDMAAKVSPFPSLSKRSHSPTLYFLFLLFS
jgi:hypothetical protein